MEIAAASGRPDQRSTWSYIASLVERHTRYVMLAKVAGKRTTT
jgi:hypothetical protein